MNDENVQKRVLEQTFTTTHRLTSQASGFNLCRGQYELLYILTRMYMHEENLHALLLYLPVRVLVVFLIYLRSTRRIRSTGHYYNNMR